MLPQTTDDNSALFFCTVTCNITEVCTNSALKWNRHITNSGLFCDTAVRMKGVKGRWKFKDVIRAIILTHMKLIWIQHFTKIRKCNSHTYDFHVDQNI